MIKISQECVNRAKAAYHMGAGDKVAAIKIIRDADGQRASDGSCVVGLKDAKDFVESGCANRVGGITTIRPAIDIVKEMLDLAEQMAILKLEMNEAES